MTANESKVLELINRVECSAGWRPLYYFSHHSLIRFAIKCFKDSDVIVVDSKNGRQYQRGNIIRRKQDDCRTD